MSSPKQILTDEQIETYHKRGFIAVDNLLTPERMAEVTAAVEDVISLYDELGDAAAGDCAAEFYREPTTSGSVLRRVERVTETSEPVKSVLTSGIILQCVSELLGEQAVLFKDKLNLKLPGGAGFAPHIDGHFDWSMDGIKYKGWQVYGTEFCNVVLSIDEAKEANGCLKIHPRRTENETYEDECRFLKNDGTPNLSEEGMKGIELKPLESGPATVIFFDWRCPHGSDRNDTDVSRRILYATYNRLSEGDNRQQYYTDKERSENSEAGKALLG